MRRLLLGTMQMIFLQNILFASHPLASDDIFTIGKKWIQWELTPEIVYLSSTIDIQTPLVFTYGVGTHVDMVIGIPFYVHFSKHSLANHIYYFDDPSMELKWNVLEEKHWGLTVKPGVSISKKHLSEHAASLFLVQTIKWQKMLFHVNQGIIWNHFIDEKKLLWHFSAAMEIPIHPKWNLVHNLYLERNEVKGNNDNPIYWISGIQFFASDYQMVDAGIRFTLHGEEKSIAFLMGITLLQH